MSAAQRLRAKTRNTVYRICLKTGGAEGDRTPDLVIANDALSHLSYGPVPVFARPAAPSGVRASARISEKRLGLQRRF